MSSSAENFINDIDTFLASSQAAPIVYSEWINMPRKMKKSIKQQMCNNNDLFKIFIYNKSRSIDRICPHCRKHYLAINTINNIENDQTGLYTKGQLEQALSGICSLECFQALNGSNVLNDWFGKIADKVYVIWKSNSSHQERTFMNKSECIKIKYIILIKRFFFVHC